MRKALNSIVALFYGYLLGTGVVIIIEPKVQIWQGIAIVVCSLIIYINRIWNGHHYE